MLSIPSFEDFLADIGDEKREEWFMSVDGMELCGSTPRTSDDFRHLSTEILHASYQITTAMLHDYHEWLVAQLSAKSVHPVR